MEKSWVLMQLVSPLVSVSRMFCGFSRHIYCKLGTVVKASNAGEEFLQKRVFVIPIQQWDDGPTPTTP